MDPSTATTAPTTAPTPVPTPVLTPALTPAPTTDDAMAPTTAPTTAPTADPTADPTAVPDPTPVTQIKTPLGDIDYRPDLRLSRASFIQLVYCYAQRLSEQPAENKWQEYAYPRLLKLFTDLRDQTTTMIFNLWNDPNWDRDVVGVNFCGYRNCKLSLIVTTQGVHHRATYATVNVRPFLKTVEQRLLYLKTATVPSRYQGDDKKINTFRRVQELAEELMDRHVHPLFEAWEKLCQEAGDYAGIKMERRIPTERGAGPRGAGPRGPRGPGGPGGPRPRRREDFDDDRRGRPLRQAFRGKFAESVN